MIEQLTVINHLGESLVFDLARPELTGLAITNIEGLGPSKANVNTTELATSDGSLFNSVKLNNRNIKFNIVYYEKKTIEDSRLISYKYFPIKEEIVLIFKTENREVYISGYVESNEPNIFSKQVSTKISIVCPDPNFYDIEQLTTNFSNVESKFEFPFECNAGNEISEERIENSYTDSRHVNEYNFSEITSYFTKEEKSGIKTTPWNDTGTGYTYVATRDIQQLTIKFKTDSYRTASSSVSRGCLFWNNELVIDQQAPDRYEGSFVENEYTITNVKAGDYFHTSTPDSSGYPKQSITVSVMEEGELLEFGEFKFFARGNVPYHGDLESGIVMKIHATGELGNLTIYNLTTSEVFYIESEPLAAIVGSRISAGDTIVINTNVGQKGVVLIREGITYNILNAIDKNADWFRLKSGDNEFTYKVDEGEVADIQVEVTSNVLYEGI